jgi:hypothetical protein
MDINWKKGELTPYNFFSETMNNIQKNNSRIKKIEILANFFRVIIEMNPSDLIYAIYLITNQVKKNNIKKDRK